VVTSVGSDGHGGVVVGRSALLTLSGTYDPNSFVESSDGQGGVLITDPPAGSNYALTASSIQPTVNKESNPSSGGNNFGAPASNTTDLSAGLDSTFAVKGTDSVEISGPSSATVNFRSGVAGTLQLDNSVRFGNAQAPVVAQGESDQADMVELGTAPAMPSVPAPPNFNFDRPTPEGLGHNVDLSDIDFGNHTTLGYLLKSASFWS
jgi:hypothetical protein